MSDTPETDQSIIGANGQWCFELRDLSRRLERQRDAYAETLRQTLVLLDTTPSIERPLVLADIIRERHPELAQEASQP